MTAADKLMINVNREIWLSAPWDIRALAIDSIERKGSGEVCVIFSSHQKKGAFLMWAHRKAFGLE